jgi:hypothetical protein
MTESEALCQVTGCQEPMNGVLVVTQGTRKREFRACEAHGRALATRDGDTYAISNGTIEVGGSAAGRDHDKIEFLSFKGIQGA